MDALHCEGIICVVRHLEILSFECQKLGDMYLGLFFFPGLEMRLVPSTHCGSPRDRSVDVEVMSG